MLRLTDLREILDYVPQFRDRIFVIAIDGAIVEEENFGNLLLRHCTAAQPAHRRCSGPWRRPPDRLAGDPANRPDAFQHRRHGRDRCRHLATGATAANRVTHEILEGLSTNDLRGAIANAMVAHPAGILQGVDHQLTGKVERIDTGLLHDLLQHDIVPVIPPLGCDGEGNTYRLNSDAVALEVAGPCKR